MGQAATPSRRRAKPKLGKSAYCDTQPEYFVLRLYVAGTTPQSIRAILDARKLCEEILGGRFQLEVIDIYQRPKLALDEQIIAVPTLVKRLPAPLRKLVGDLSNSERVLIGLDLLDQKRAKNKR